MLLRTSIISALQRSKSKKKEAIKNSLKRNSSTLSGPDLRRMSRSVCYGDDAPKLDFSMDCDFTEPSIQAEGGGFDNIASLAQKEAQEAAPAKEPIHIGSVFTRKTQDFKKLNELQKYKEIQRRTKLLYGVKDVRKMISKTTETTSFYKKDICCNSDDDNDGESESEKDKVQNKDKKVSLRDCLKAENFIISMNSQWKAVFDTSILLVIGYSCFTTVLYISFDITTGPFLSFIDNVVTACFALDFIFNFFQEYQDKETFARVRDHKKLAIRYFKSGWMFLDFIATFPFDLVFGQGQYARLIRLARLSKLVKLLDIGRIKRLVKSYFDQSTRADRI